MISGFVHPDFGGVTQSLRRVATHRRGGGAAVAVFHDGELVVDAWVGARDALGTPWCSDTMAMSFSTTKGVIATTVHRLVDRGAARLRRSGREVLARVRGGGQRARSPFVTFSATPPDCTSCAA